MQLSRQNWTLGRSGNQLSVTSASGQVYLIPLTQNIVTTLSRDHARIRYAADSVFVEDRHSANGVFLNGLPLRPLQPAALESGDRLRLGALQLTVILMPCQEKHPQ